MFTRLAVQDYQSIKRAGLTLAPFTVIVGRNRSGKSALLRALRAAISNETGDAQIRRGQKQAVVEVETLEGDIVTWTKTRASAEYELNGIRFTKLAGGVPDAVAGALGVRSVVVDASLTLTPQLHEQGEYAFLVDRSQGQAAKALAKMTRLDVVVKAQQDCKAAIRELTNRRKELTRRLAHDFDALDEWDTDVAERAIKRNERLQAESLDLLNEIMQAEVTRAWLAQLEDAEKQVCPPLEVAFDDLQTAVDAVAGAWVQADAYERPVLPAVSVKTVALEERLESLLVASDMSQQNEWAGQAIVSFDDALGVYEAHRQETAEKLDGLKGAECPVCGGTL